MAESGASGGRRLSAQDQSMMRRMSKVFQSFDTDKNKSLDKDEIRIGLMRFGLGSSDEDVRQMLKKMDTNGDGVIDLDEWIEHMDEKVRTKLSDAFDRMGVSDGLEQEVNYQCTTPPKCDSPRYCKEWGIEGKAG